MDNFHLQDNHDARIAPSEAISSLEATEPPQEHPFITGSPVAQTEMTQAMQALMAEMQRLRQDFDTKIKYDASKERQVDSLHQELQLYREGFHFKILNPIFIDLIAVYDDLNKLVEGLMGKEIDHLSAQLLENLQSFQETIEDILHRNGATSYSLEGDTYIPGKQRVMQVIDTTDPHQERKVARRIRKGFAYDDRVLRPEHVAIYRGSPNSI